MKGLTKLAKLRRFAVFVACFAAIHGALVRIELKTRIGVDEFLISDENECFKDLKCTPKWFNKYVQIHTAILAGILPFRIRIFPASVNGVGDRLRGWTHVFFLALLDGHAFLAEYPSPKDMETDIMQDLFLPRYLFWNRSIATSNLTSTGDATVDLLFDYDPPLMRARSTDVADISYIPDDLLNDVRIGGAHENYGWLKKMYPYSKYNPQRKGTKMISSRRFKFQNVSSFENSLTDTDIVELRRFLESQKFGVTFEESMKRTGYGGWEFYTLMYPVIVDPSVPSIIKEIIGEMVQDGWLNIGRWTIVLHYLVQIAPRLRTAFAQNLKSLLEQIAEKNNNTEITDFLKTPPNLEKLSVQTPNSFSNYLKSRMSLSIGQLIGLHIRTGDVNAFEYHTTNDDRVTVSNTTMKSFFRCADYLTWKLGFKNPIYVFFSDHTGVRKTVGDNPGLYTSYPLVVPHLGTGSTYHLFVSVDENQEERTMETWSEFLVMSSLDAILRSDSQYSIAASFFAELKSSNHMTYFPYFGCFRPKASKLYI